MNALTCPYCFAAVPRDGIAFRCVGRSGRGPGCAPELDERLARYTGSTAAASLPPVFSPAKRGRGGNGPLARALRAGASLGGGLFGGAATGGAATGGAAARATCPRCGRPTGRRVCPECHNPLPAAYCDTTGRIVALVGAKNAGKSTYIAVLLHELMNRVGTELDVSLVACDDRTIDRFKRDFARPLFDERRLLPTTASAATTPREPLVYLLTRTHSTRTGRDRNAALTLVLFDTAGEDLRSRDVTDLHLRYLEAADAIIFLVDPHELPGGGSTDSDPIDVIARATEVVRGRRGTRRDGRLDVPAAVALTKIDAMLPTAPRQSALHRARSHPGALDLDDREAVHEQVRALLHERQGGQLDLYLSQHYAHYALFGVSALGGTPNDGRVAPGGVRPYRVEDPLLWLLHRFGMLDGR